MAPKRFQGLDVLRGAAIFLVLFNHLQANVIPGLPELHGVTGGLYWRLKNFGWTGVDLFFVLSGFLISGLLFKELETTQTLALGRFWLRRSFKILPSYFFLLLVLALTGASNWWSASQAGEGLVRWSHILFFQNYLVANANGPTWSLAVEEHFYWALPCLLLLLQAGGTRTSCDRRLLAVGALIVGGGVVIRILHARHGVVSEDFRLTHFRFDSLFVGVVLQWLWRRQHPVVQWVIQNPRKAALIASLCLAPGLFAGRTGAGMFAIGYSFLALGYAILMIVFLAAYERRNGGILAKIGTWSYNIYLWNFFLSKLPIPGYNHGQQWLVAHLPHDGRLLVAQGALFMTTAILVGALMTRLIEAPFLALRDRVVPGRSRAAAPAAQEVMEPVASSPA